MRPGLIFLLVLAAALPTAAQDQTPSAQVQTRRVTISLTFSGQDVFLFGRVMPGTQRILAVMEGPPAGEVRLMEQGRVGPIWMGVRQYRLTGVPALYLVNVTGPLCDGSLMCANAVTRAAWDALPNLAEPLLGLDAIRARARVATVSGGLAAGEAERVLDGFWQLQARRDLYVMRGYAIRMNPDGVFYHRFMLPTQAPEGKYRITTYFLAGDRILGTAENELFLRKSGFVAWLSRLAERQAFSYGVFTVLIAVTAGWLAGAVFKRGGGH
ncbi:MAG: TIGR02186 family protein [Candidatus Methylomirabilales bacterium]